MTVKKCTKCNGDDFIIQETLIHEAALCAEDGCLTVYKENAGGIDRIFCKKCEKEYSEDDFKQINFE